MIFNKKKEKTGTYDRSVLKPMIKASICNGERVAGFMDLKSRRFEEIMLVRNDADLEEFKRRYGIIEEIETIY